MKKLKETVETFKAPFGYILTQWIRKEPSCFNGSVNVEKYSIVVERISESTEVYAERLQKLWDECDNYHNWEPLKSKAKELGVELKGNAGSKRKDR